MYKNFFGLKENPFEITPNPDYLYLSPNHENALIFLEYGLMKNVGFILLTGEVGAGKTTLVRYLTSQFKTEKEIAVIFNTNVTPDEFLCLTLKSFKLEPLDGNRIKNLDILEQFLIDRQSKNKQVLLIIDEAQNLSDAALEEVRMLSNLQSHDQSLMQIMLVGQPELKDRLLKSGHNPFAQRIAVNFFLPGLTEKETESYIFHRLKKAGGNPDIFSPKAIEMIFQASKGIPRTINLLSDAALAYGFGFELKTIDISVIEQVIKDKGGMGLHVETENKDHAFSFCNEKIHKEDMDRIQRLEDAFVLMKRQVDYVVKETAKFEEKVKDFQESLDGTLKDFLLKEQKQNKSLLMAYSRIKVKYENLLKLWKWKKEAPASDDNGIILLNQESPD
jgi:type II secretory pathway predicted ATPase ExeA